jgi:hypothetical protein
MKYEETKIMGDDIKVTANLSIPTRHSERTEFENIDLAK